VALTPIEGGWNLFCRHRPYNIAVIVRGSPGEAVGEDLVKMVPGSQRSCRQVVCSNLEVACPYATAFLLRPRSGNVRGMIVLPRSTK